MSPVIAQLMKYLHKLLLGLAIVNVNWGSVAVSEDRR